MWLGGRKWEMDALIWAPPEAASGTRSTGKAWGRETGKQLVENLIKLVTTVGSRAQAQGRLWGPGSDSQLKGVGAGVSIHQCWSSVEGCLPRVARRAVVTGESPQAEK